MLQDAGGGVWPTMITPFTESNEIDYVVLERLIEWYIAHGVDGLFAVCQSSEMFYLTLEERVQLAAFVKEKAGGRVPVIASGHISDREEDQVTELKRLADTGIDALILITNRLAKEKESDGVWQERLERLLQQLPASIPLGFYECPYPYKRLISPELLEWCAATGRFKFLKDTSCDVDNMRAKMQAVQGSPLQIYNANSATLLETVKLGIKGYSGVMANFHPELYVWLLQHAESNPEQAEHIEQLEQLSDFLSMASFIEKQVYPVNAKYYLMLAGVLTNYRCRSKNHEQFTATNRLEVEQFYRWTQSYIQQYI